jgi:hypothetical protein
MRGKRFETPGRIIDQLTISEGNTQDLPTLVFRSENWTSETDKTFKSP